MVFSPYNYLNPGHTMLILEPTYDNQLAVHYDLDHDKKKMTLDSYKYKRVYGLLSKRPLGTLDGFYGGDRKKQYCFDQIAVGITRFGYGWNGENKGIGWSLRGFRDFVYTNFKTTVPPKNVPHLLTFSVFTKKGQTSYNKGGGGRYSLTKTDELADALNRWYPGCRVSVNVWDGMDLKKQVQLMTDTDVMITQSGGGSMNSIFMRDGEVLLSLYVPVVTQEGKDAWAASNEKQYWIDNSPHFRAYDVAPPLVYRAAQTEKGYRSFAIDISTGKFKAMIDYALVTPVLPGLLVPCYGTGCHHN